jgi:hypothetical protein
MTRADILALGTQASPVLIFASDTNSYFAIFTGQDGGDAIPVVVSRIAGLTGATEIRNFVAITKAGYAAITPDANTYYLITDASMGDYGFPVLGEWTADTGSTAATPAAGELRWNNATQTSATNLYLDGVTAGGIDMAALLLLVASGDKILIQSGVANYQIWQLTAAPSVDTGNWTLPVTLLSSDGTGYTGFADAAALIVAVRPAGDRRIVTDYLVPSALTSSAGIAWNVNTTNQPTLTLAHATTITLSNLADGQSASLSGIMGGSGGYTVALAHSGLTVRVMGGALADIAALAANDLFEISVKRSGTDLRVWVNTLEI